MATKPNEIRHSQVSCELENYTLQRGQSLAYTADLNSDSVYQLTDLDYVESVDADPTVNISMDTNEFGSTLLFNILSGRYEGYADETFNVEDIMLNPVDLLVSVKESSSATLANRSAWFNYCFVDSISGSYQVDGFASESVSLTGNSMRWYSNADSTNFGATKILKFDVVDGTGQVDSFFDDLNQPGYLHVLTDNGQIVPTSRYIFDTLTHSVVPYNDFSFVDGHRYRGVFYNRSDFPTPNDVLSPIGGIVSKEIEIVMWDSNTDPIDWQTAVGTETTKQILRLQSVDYEVAFDREALRQTMTGLFSQSVNSVNITSSISAMDSDLEHWARTTGHWADYTDGTLDSMNLSDFQNMNSLCMRIDIFNTKDYANHNAGTLLKQLYFTGGKVTSIGDTRDVPGRGTQSFDIRFSTLIIRGTGAQGRSSQALWGGKEFAFIFISDDGASHNVGWADAYSLAGVPNNLTLAVQSERLKTISTPSLSQAQINTLYTDGNAFINHTFDHCNGGPSGWNNTNAPGLFGTLRGYIIDATQHHVFTSWSQAMPYYKNNIDRDTLTYLTSTGARIPNQPRSATTTMAFPGNAFLPENMWDAYRLGYKGARVGYSWNTINHFPVDRINTRDAISIMRVPLAVVSDVLVGGTTDAYTEGTVKAAAANMFSQYRNDGTFHGGMCVIYAHSYGIDAYHVTNYPNGWPLTDGTVITAYTDGIRKTELKWILEEAVAQNGKVMNFKDAVDQYWQLGHYLDNPELTYGMDYTNDIIFVAGAGDKYPSGEDFSVPTLSDSDVQVSYRIATLPGQFSIARLYTTGQIDFTTGEVPIMQVILSASPADTRLTQRCAPASLNAFSTTSLALTNSTVVPSAGNRAWSVFADQTIEYISPYTMYDLTNGYATLQTGNTNFYMVATIKGRMTPVDQRDIAGETDWMQKTILFYGPGGIYS